ncbi:monovalent cation/H+ antiporter complex subunit F [Winkia neuii]|uniref:PH regulation protein F n=2 Tax=Winkia neuii TaxID=33007 RepID=A0A2I1IMG7_9ACTO|nr:monovalent cation/H+ antiporter complex subunit F [Winkia neuii]PKY72307.1 hypothetical protein CYJ19_05505 [Winkia neuii]
MHYLLVAAGCFLAVAVLLTLYRLEKGPSLADRAIATDLLTAVLVGVIAVSAALFSRDDLMYLLVIIALVGFISSATIGRVARHGGEENRRVITLAEERARRRKLQAEEMKAQLDKSEETSHMTPEQKAQVEEEAE